MALRNHEVETSRKLQFEPTHVDSLDARALQYKYALVKLSLFIQALNRLLIKETSNAKDANTKDTKDQNESKDEIIRKDTRVIFLVHYMSYCIAHMFAINEAGFAPKLKALEDFKPLKAATVPISAVVSHAPYDEKDYPVKPLTELPLAGKSLLCLKALRAMCINCFEGYQKRYTNACAEIDNPAYIGDLNYLFEQELFGIRKDLDLSLQSVSLPILPLQVEVDPAQLGDGDYEEANLVDMDLFALFTFILDTSTTLSAMKPPIEKLRVVRSTPKNSQDLAFAKVPNSAYSLHKLLFWAFRLNDLYLIFRKFIRQIYFSNLQHLNDRKFLLFVPKESLFLNRLQELNEISTSAKRNGILVATITRFVRMNSKHSVNAKSSLDFIGFVHQFLGYLESNLELTKSFGQMWLVGEISFRKEHDLYTDHLEELYKMLQKNSKTKFESARENKQPVYEKEKEEVLLARRKLLAPLRKQTSPQKLKLEPIKRQEALSWEESIESMSDEERKTGVSLTSRHSDISALSSPVSLTEEILLTLPDFKKDSPTKQNHRKSLMIHRTSSTSSLPGTPRPSSTVNRTRSSSQPLAYRSVNFSKKPEDSKKISAQNHAQYLRSHASKTQLSLSTTTTFQANDDLEQTTKKLSASQKLQLHLQEASKAGALYGRERQSLTSVVFDPNNPSASNIKRSSRLFVKSSLENGSNNSSSKPVTNSLSRTSSLLISSSAAATASRIRVEKKPQELRTSRSDDNLPNNGAHSKAQKLRHTNEENSSTDFSDDSKPPSSTAVEALPRPTRAQITKQNTRRNSVVIRKDPEGSSVSSLELPISASLSSVATDASNFKKVRFTGVPKWTPAEDAPLVQSQRILKNFASLKLSTFSNSSFKQKDSLFKKEESILFREQLNGSEVPASHTLGASYTSRFASLRNKMR